MPALQPPGSASGANQAAVVGNGRTRVDATVLVPFGYGVGYTSGYRSTTSIGAAGLKRAVVVSNGRTLVQAGSMNDTIDNGDGTVTILDGFDFGDGTCALNGTDNGDGTLTLTGTMSSSLRTLVTAIHG